MTFFSPDNLSAVEICIWPDSKDTHSIVKGKTQILFYIVQRILLT